MMRACTGVKLLSTRQLAELAGFPNGNSDVSRIETGKMPRPSGPKLAAYAQVLRVATEWLMTGEGPRERVPAERTVELDGEIDPVLARVAEGRGYSEQVLRQASAGRGAYGTNFTEQAAMELLEITARYARDVERAARLAELEAATGRAPISKVGGGNEVEDDDELARKRKAALRKR